MFSMRNICKAMLKKLDIFYLIKIFQFLAEILSFENCV